MKVMQVINKVDSLYPNNYTTAEKISWCEELSHIIRQTVKKVYSYIDMDYDGKQPLLLPYGVDFEQIEYVFLDGKQVDKADFRSFSIYETDRFVYFGDMPSKIRVAYLTKYEGIRDVEAQGTFLIGLEKDSDGCDTAATINIECSPFISGDVVLYAVGTNAFLDANRFTVLDVDSEKIYIPKDKYDNFGGYNDVSLKLKRVITEETEVSAPYDRMYIEYVLAQINYFQHDFEGYNVHMAQYNTLFDSYKKWYKDRNPLNKLARYRNYW